jgi:hypothetical protein
MWYAASLLFKSIHSGSVSSNIWEESIRLIQADTSELALKKANFIGAGEKVNYIVHSGDTVTWEFVKVERVYEIMDEQIKDGTELFSRFLRDSEAESLLTPFNE